MTTDDCTIHIAAALIDDGLGHVLLVRKSGTKFFMQAGGKIEAGEDPLAALRRELLEEIGLTITGPNTPYLGQFSETAANEANATVLAELFHIRTDHNPIATSEIEQAVWVGLEEAEQLELAPLTRHHVLPLAKAL